MLLGLVLLTGGIVLIVCGADWFTDGALRTAAVMAMSPFVVSLVVSGLEPENLTARSVPVVERSRSGRRLVGMVSRGDLLRGFASAAASNMPPGGGR